MGVHRGWLEYAKKEFSLSKSRVYQILDQGKVNRAIEEASGSTMVEPINERIARAIKPRLSEVTAEISERVEHGEAPSEAVQAVVYVPRPDTKYFESRKYKGTPNRIVAGIVSSAMCMFDVDMEALNFTALDQACIPVWVQELRKAAREITKFANRLEKSLAKNISSGNLSKEPAE